MGLNPHENSVVFFRATFPICRAHVANCHGGLLLLPHWLTLKFQRPVFSGNFKMSALGLWASVNLVLGDIRMGVFATYQEACLNKDAYDSGV
jgi:hypothetical protein